MDWLQLGRRRVRGLALSGVICAGVMALGAPSAVADDGVVPAPPPASSWCQGPGCTDDQGGVLSMLLAPGNGPGCADGGACFWVQTDFDGDKGRADDVPWGRWLFVPDIDRFRSAKNRYAARRVLTGNDGNVTSCMDPGEDRANIEASDRIKVGLVGFHC